MPVGAQRVGEHLGVEPVVFVAGRAIAAAERFDLAARDHDDLQPAASSAWTTGPSGRSIATWPTPSRTRRRVNPRSSLPVWGTSKRARTWPSGSSTHTACRRDAQSRPATRDGMAASMVILSAGGTQREGVNAPPVRDAVAGGSLIGARERVALLPLSGVPDRRTSRTALSLQSRPGSEAMARRHRGSPAL